MSEKTEDQVFYDKWEWKVAKGGYAINRAGTCILPFRATKPEDWQSYKSYSPLWDYPNLYKTFADVNLSPDGVLDFANEFGLLGLSGVTIGYQGVEVPDEEPIQAWFEWIREMKEILDFWELVQICGEEAGIKKYAVRESDKQALQDKINEWLNRDPPLLFSLKDLLTNKGVRESDYTAIARYFIYLRLEDRVKREWLPMRPVWHLSSRRLTYRVLPQNLMAALWLQLGRYIENNIGRRRCLMCTRVLLIGKSHVISDRAHKHTCNDRCRSQLRNQRQKVLPLIKKGMNVRKIVSYTGIEEHIVRFLFLQQKEKQKKTKRRKAK